MEDRLPLWLQETAALDQRRHVRTRVLWMATLDTKEGPLACIVLAAMIAVIELMRENETRRRDGLVLGLMAAATAAAAINAAIGDLPLVIGFSCLRKAGRIGPWPHPPMCDVRVRTRRASSRAEFASAPEWHR